MGVYAIIIATILYMLTSVSSFRQKDYPHSLMWFAYSLANIGLLWYEINKIRGISNENQ